MSTLDDVFGKITPPPQIRGLTDLGGAGGLGYFFSRVIELIYVAASLIFVFMVLYSALQWILSGGDKEKVGAARNRLVYAIIGITFLAFAFIIIRILGAYLNFTFFEYQDTEKTLLSANTYKYRHASS